MPIQPSLIKRGVQMIIDGLDVNGDPNFVDTPRRVAKLYSEMFNPPKTGWPVFDEDYTDWVVICGHEFYTLCPHHLVPVKIEAAVGYIPNGKVIGMSKLLRMIDEANTKPLTQERLTWEIVRKIKEYTQGTSHGEAVLLKGEHGCMRIRGIRSHSSRAITRKFTGEFDTAENRAAFMELIRK